MNDRTQPNPRAMYDRGLTLRAICTVLHWSDGRLKRHMAAENWPERPLKHQPPYTPEPERDRAARAAYKNGTPAHAVAVILGCAESTMLRYAKANGWTRDRMPRPGKPYNPKAPRSAAFDWAAIDMTDIRRRYNTGESMASMAKLCECDPKTLRSYVAKLGWARKPAKKGPKARTACKKPAPVPVPVVVAPPPELKPGYIESVAEWLARGGRVRTGPASGSPTFAKEVRAMQGVRV